MNCPVDGCENAVESGPNCYVEVETPDSSLKKLVCKKHADQIMGFIK